ncbi:cytochrome b N-terminal domain-containing protein [Vulgatibacter sp.]|uniref:cytochrome b N-terminal domain-containing protein n=1 Tax=Vulgatibacter sp. TaxID=1971226 RepID=UPI00356AB66A
MNPFRALWAWFYDRFRLPVFHRFIQEHRVPKALAGRKGWFYILGNATLAAFLVQVVTGIALTSKYVATPAHAYESLQHITDVATLGWLIRALHYFGASAMVILIVLHACRTFLTGSYKFPREASWMTGVVLLFLTSLLAFSGQLLRWNQDGVWAVVVAAQFASRVPLVGAELAEFVLAGQGVGGPTLSRFYSLHTIVLPVLVVAVVSFHLYLVIENGISEPPESGKPVDKRTYRAQYEKLKEHGADYFPDTVWREAIAALVVVAVIFALAFTFGPKTLGAPPDPTTLSARPRPDWFLIWYYAVLWLKPRGAETLVMVYLPLGTLFFLFVMPILFGKGERSPLRRPWAIPIVVGILASFASLIWLGLRAPWEPDYETKPIPTAVIGAAEGPVYEGALLFHERGCQICHRVLDHGGAYGPDLTNVTTRLSPEEVAVRTVMGFGDMPAYRDAITDAELGTIVAFLKAIEGRKQAAGASTTIIGGPGGEQ